MPGSYTNTKSVMESRRARAEAIQAANKRTPTEQLAQLDKLGLIAAKERAKLYKRIAEEDSTPKKVKKTIGDPVNGRGATVWVNK